MQRFISYYGDLLKLIFTNIWNFLKDFTMSIVNVLILDFIGYFHLIKDNVGAFKFLDWLFFILSFIINLVIVAIFFYFLYKVVRRYVRFVKREVDKDKQDEKIRELTSINLRLIEEKNKILNLQMERYGFKAQELLGEGEDKSYRFAKLRLVDKLYSEHDPKVTMVEEYQLSLEEIVDRFVNYSASRLGLYYPKKVVAAYIAGMATSKIIILEGISGTGKTSLPYAMGKFFSFDAAIIPVQPSWRDRAEMIGYLNEFTEKFNETGFLESLYESTYRNDVNFIVLDELNLARVEYYFADFLSLMEMPNQDEWLIDIVPEQLPGDPKQLVDGRLKVSPNIWFIGTANQDDSTFMITDKVYDRAVSIEMNAKAVPIDAPLTDPVFMEASYLENLFEEAIRKYPLSDKALEQVEKMGDFIIDKFKIAFGNRIMAQLHKFIPVFVAAGMTEAEGLDYMISRKVLRKFESLNLPFLQDELNELIVFIEKTFGKDTFEECIEMINGYRRRV